MLTPAGSDLIYMRLSDAIDELEGLEGQRAHRSWWVAKSAVAAIVSRGRKTELRLTSGLLIPVSRNAAQAVREGFGGRG